MKTVGAINAGSSYPIRFSPSKVNLGFSMVRKGSRSRSILQVLGVDDERVSKAPERARSTVDGARTDDQNIRRPVVNSHPCS